ncbi:DUF4249 domain-containing protein [Pontibacter silvestris]|uniref:DUF4249 domain-containing protein n=1 Tax=Pontibacter silvestris TaxID=2305183 RepID=A0ABW4WUG9_9BACT|nr:DUF4249 domain-containing protein [Pontibacter silvestris]MCC9138416.1 DUF4249 domain-containing protein [Pontibacter silvestris]
MKPFILLLYFLTILLVFCSCEEVIELDLKEVEPEVVIEGVITDQPGPYTVEISKSAGFYEPNTFPAISGASVVISDGLGNEELLTEVSPGIYQPSTLQGQRGVTYTLKVEIEGKAYTAQSKIPDQQIPLDSLTFSYEEKSLFLDEGYYATAYFHDPAGAENFYRLKVLVNDEVYVFEDDDETTEDTNLWLTRDKFTNGNVVEYDFPHTLKPGDTVYVELHHLNQDTYDYYRTFADVIDGSAVAPSNPISNFGDQALGHFAAFSVSYKTAIVK